MTTPVLAQVQFRARNDDVALNSGTFTHLLNANFTQAVNTPFRVRFTIAETAGGMANNIAFSVQYNLNGAGYVAIGDTAAVRSTLSSQFANGDPTTQVISTGTFVAGIGVEQTTTSNITLTSQRTEVEWCLLIDSAQVVNNDSILLRIVQDTGSVLQTYTQTPTITVSETAVTASPSAGALTTTGQAPTLVASSALEPTTAALSATGLAPTVTTTANIDAQPGVGALSITGLAPTFPVGLTERLTPNTILASTNLQDSALTAPPALLTDLDEEPGSPGGDTLWWTAIDPEADIDVRLGFPTSSGNLVGTQFIRVLIRGTSLPSRDGTVELWENGAPAPGSPTVQITDEVTSISGQVVTLPFQPEDLADPTGAGVEIRIRAAA